MKMNPKVKAVLIVAATVAILVGAVVAYAAYSMYSNTITGTVTTQATLTLTLNGSTANGTNIVEGSQVTLVATCSDSTHASSISFYNGATFIGGAVPILGVATYTYTIPVGSTSFSFTATGSHT